MFRGHRLQKAWKLTSEIPIKVTLAADPVGLGLLGLALPRQQPVPPQCRSLVLVAGDQAAIMGRRFSAALVCRCEHAVAADQIKHRSRGLPLLR
jgi:hypothetical protein